MAKERKTDRRTPSRNSTGSSRSRTTAPARSGAAAPAFLDADSRREIVGVVIAALGVALSIAVMTSAGGVVGGAIAAFARRAVGLGAYLVPVLLLLWAASFFVRGVRIDETRVGIGLAFISVAVISMRAVAAPAETFWVPETLVAHGGYLGGGVAWLLISLVGPAISYVALTALLLVGLIFAGLSLTELVGAARSRFARDSHAESEVPGRRRAAKTMPLRDMPEDTALDAVLTGAAASRRAARGADPESARQTIPSASVTPPRSLEGFELPSIGILNRTPASATAARASEKELRHTATIIEQTLATFDISARVVSWIAGPTVTMFETEIGRGVKVGRVTALADDLALALAAPTVRILAPIPGKSYVGFEVPNAGRSTVTLGDVLHGPAVSDPRPLLLAVGKDVAGEEILADLASMPHLLIAGATGMGKSVCINALIMTLLMRATPAEVRLILIDPKRIELTAYNGVPHLYVPVVTESKEAASALHWAVGEMDARLKRLQKAGAKNIGQYNTIIRAGKGPEGAEELPYLVIVIDELADLMMVAARDVEDSICRLAQLARAAGIHLIVATQRPSADIITGLIKANITNRIAFAVSQSIDSRVILDQAGAEKLVGLGDMLFSTPAWTKPKRIQGAFVSEDEITAAVAHLKAQAEPEYHEEILHLKVGTAGTAAGGASEDDDPLLWEAADIVVTSGMGSTSLLQRRLKVGYARAGRIMDMLEGRGVVGPPDGSKPREVLADVEELESLKVFEREEREAGE